MHRHANTHAHTHIYVCNMYGLAHTLQAAAPFKDAMCVCVSVCVTVCACACVCHQFEVNKKREVELQRLRRDLEETTVQSDALVASLRKRHGDTMTELSEQCESLQRTRAKLEKEKQNLRMEVEDLASALDTLQKTKVRGRPLPRHLTRRSLSCTRGVSASGTTLLNQAHG